MNHPQADASGGNPTACAPLRIPTGRGIHHARIALQQTFLRLCPVSLSFRARTASGNPSHAVTARPVLNPEGEHTLPHSPEPSLLIPRERDGRIMGYTAPDSALRGWRHSYAAVLSRTRRPARVAKVMSISRLNFSHLPRTRSETRD